MIAQVTLYTSQECRTESNELRGMLEQLSLPFQEQDVTARPDINARLMQQFGHEFTLPGVQFNDRWITETTNLREVVGQYWVDHMLQGNRTTPAASNVRSNATDDIAVSAVGGTKLPPVVLPDPTMAFNHDQHEILVEPARAIQPPPAAATMRGLAPFKLPDGRSMAVGDLLRKLLQGTTHHCITQEGQPYYYFRGHEGMELWTLLFFGHMCSDGDDDEHANGALQAELVNFGQTLVSRGIVHNYTPQASDFRAAFLVLQPLQEPHVLNTFVRWPTWTYHCIEDDPMDVILRLSRLCDDVCSLPQPQDHALFYELEEAVCQLQVVGFPTDPVEKVTFGLNLFNLMVRHAALVAADRQWTWPSNLTELAPFSGKIGYAVGGEWLSMADLQASLYGRNGAASLPALTKQRDGSWWAQVGCRYNAATLERAHYTIAVIRTDHRIVFATSLGAASSPAVATIYPNKLDEGLQQAAEQYMQNHLLIKPEQGSVILPAMVSWYRMDFGGGSPEQALDQVLPYLSVAQLRQIRDLRDSKRGMHVVFGLDGFDWTCRVHATHDSTPQQQQSRPPLAGTTEVPREYVIDNVDEDNGSRSMTSIPWRGVMRFLGRQPSRGEGQLLSPPARNKPAPTAAASTGFECDLGMPSITDYDDDSLDDRSYFECDMSEITLDTHFKSLLKSKAMISKRRLQV